VNLESHTIGGGSAAAIAVSVALLLTVFRAALAAELVRAGVEFQVNSYTTSTQYTPDVASGGDGDFVVVWASRQDGHESGVFGRRFASTGIRLAAEFQINQQTTNYQNVPVVAVGQAGEFVVTWTGGQHDGSSFGVFARRFGSNGTALGAEFQVNLFTTGYQGAPAVAIGDDGDFVVAWTDIGQDGDDDGVFARRFESTGTAIGGELQVNLYTTSNQRTPAVATRADGGFVVVFHSYRTAGFSVFGRRYDSGGAAVGGDFQVNVATLFHAFYSTLAIEEGDGFIVAWESHGQDGDNRGIFARRFASSGAALGGDFQVNSRTTSAQMRPAVAIEPGGGFLVVWQSSLQDGSFEGVFAQRFESSGSRHGSEFQVNTHTDAGQLDPRLAIDAHGRVVVVWDSAFQDEDSDGVFAQRLVPISILDVDGDGDAEPLTDGLLILRWRFGFTGSTLITAALDVGSCTRCTAPAIEAYLASILASLDIDGDNEIAALTDGLLILRWLFGFNGPSLIAGAVDVVNCTRCTTNQIEGYLQGLAP
jgi:hypothetical protein